MQNVTVSRNGNKLTLVVDLSQNIGPSKATLAGKAKNLLIGSTQGTHKVTVDGKTIHIGMNVWTEQAPAAI